MYALACLATFVAAYHLSTGAISIFYHRGLTHGGLRLTPARGG